MDSQYKNSDMEGFIKNLKDNIEALENVDIEPDTDFNLLPDWDSVAKLSVMAMVSSEYGVVLTGEDVASALSIGELWNKVQARL